MTDPLESANNTRREVIAHHEAGVRGVLLVEYRCRAKGCLLLRVWQTPNGPEFLASGYRLSNRYTLAGREGETWDWGGRLDDYPATLWVPLMCNHVTERTCVSEIRRDLAGRTPGNPTRILWPPGDTPSRG
jgi:hypothetical protein